MNATLPQVMDDAVSNIYVEIEKYTLEYAKAFQFEYKPWIFSVFGSIAIGLSGIFPLLVIPADAGGADFNDPIKSKLLKILLSFAVGGLLGDVFLNLLPKAFGSDEVVPDCHPPLRNGLWILSGVLMFTIVEKVFSAYADRDESDLTATSIRKSNEKKDTQTIQVSGYLNLIAHYIDNFTKGLAVVGSFLVSFRHGVLGTLALLLHGIPQEVGDFAILLRSGFSRWDAAKAQVLIASAGQITAVLAVGSSSVTTGLEAQTSWIAPFTAGGFLYISLVTIMPDLLKECDSKESIKQSIALVAGVGTTALMTFLFES